jgi:hypothetical protein
MKKLTSTIAMLLLLAFGCTDQTNITSPEQSVQTQEPNWIALPQGTGLQVNQIFSVSKNIVHKDGGTMSLNASYQGGNYGTVTITSTLFFPKACEPGKGQVYTMSHDDSYCVTTFGPPTDFDKELTFNITYTGVNLTGINPSTVKFAYIAADGSVQYAVNDGIIVNLATGKLGVINAKIPHFSRYGFVN